MTAYPLASTLVLLAAVLAWSFGCAEPTAQRAPGRTAAEPAGATRVAAEEGERVQISGRWATAWASSELASDDARYGAAKAFDGDPATAWVEGVEGVGARTDGTARGETLTVEFDEPIELDAVGFVLGYAKSPRLFVRNAAPTVIGLTTNGDETDLSVSYAQDVVADGRRFGDEDLGSDHRLDGCYHSDAAVNVDARRLVVFERPRMVRRLTLEIAEARPGTHYMDTALSEIVPIAVGGPSTFAPAIISVLKSLRRPGEVEPHLLPGAIVQDLRSTYLSPGLDAQSQPGSTAQSLLVKGLDGYEAVAWARVPNEKRLGGESPESRFVRYVRPSLVGALVTVTDIPGGEQVVGARSFHHGDCEWVESYPRIQLRGDRVSRLDEWVTGDGCPGCTWRLPTAEDP